MKRAERELLVEAALTAYRPRRADGEVHFHPAFHDLDGAGREDLFVALSLQRRLEAAAASDGLSTTARAVLRRIHGA